MNISHTFYLALSFSLFFAPLPVSAIADEITKEIAHFEEEIIAQNSDTIYIDLSEKRSNIKAIVSQLSNLDDQNDSPLHALNKHIKRGFSIAESDAVTEALGYATAVLKKNHAKLT